MLFLRVDMHAMTVEYDPAALPDRVRGVAAAYIAAGVDPKRSAIFAQSAVPEHAELSWVLQCVARMGWMERMTQFKDKAGSGKDAERASVGLFTYPVLHGGGHPGLQGDPCARGRRPETASGAVARHRRALQPRLWRRGRSSCPLPEPVILPTARVIMSAQGRHQENVEIRSQR
jgi:tryptophanyl-tRNA synthetase